ncbi:MAG: dCTP deaminase, partial [Symploca sp. SIO2G7]|nr:dCTP deaminase [Symploca sp. SIO2G7]
LVRKMDMAGSTMPVISYGLSSFGYDIRLSSKEFRIFRHIPGTVIDPKHFNPDNLEPTQIRTDKNGSYFILPAHSYGLGVALERLEIPENITTICIGKSTYARCGIIANLTPAEAGWRGYLTLEFSNSSSADCRIYANEGVVQLLFLEGEPCQVSYKTRNGKYQDQIEMVTLARV